MVAHTRLSAFLLIAVLSGCVISACHTAQKYLESGDYDDAISYCVNKLRGKTKKKTELVQGLELAFKKAQARDLNTADHLIASGRPENWERINALHRQIRDRQNKIAPLLPLRSKDGYQAKFEFADIGRMESQSREKAAEYLYSRAVNLIQQAQGGDRLAARDAYNILKDLEARYYRQYKDKDHLMVEARTLGTTHILFQVKNKSNKVLPRDFADRVLSISASDLNSEWRQFHIDATPGEPIDYRVVFNIRNVEISPERVNERSYVDEKEIQDGFDYVLDERGNVKKDTAGNDIKTPRYIHIRANVLEVFQSKAARLTGALEVLEVTHNTRLDTRELSTEIRFENYASTFRGDKRALSEESICRIGNRPLPFPPDEEMLIQAADRIRPDIRDELRRNRTIL